MAERTLRDQQRYERWSQHDSLYADPHFNPRAPASMIIVQN
jgi:hypothetical protein